MATAHQYPDYTPSSNEYYGNYCNQSYGSYIPSGPYNYDMPTSHDNNNVNYYPASANWVNQYNQAAANAYQQPSMNAANHLPYNDQQCRQQTQHSQQLQQQLVLQSHQQQQQQTAMATQRFLSPPYNTPYESSHQLNINHNYMDNHMKKLNEPEPSKIDDAYHQAHRNHMIEPTAATGTTLATTAVTTTSNAITAANNETRLSTSGHQTSYANAANAANTSPKNAAKRPHTDDNNDSPALRALLTNRKLRYSPDYSAANIIKRQKTMVNDFPLHHHHTTNACAPSVIDTIALSPMKTEDSVDFLDDFPLYGKTAIPTPHSTGIHSSKAGYAYGGAQMRSPLTMTCENLHPAANSPMTNYVAGISTPPLSPKEAEPVNHMRLSDTSSPDKTAQPQWLQNGNDCE